MTMKMCWSILAVLCCTTWSAFAQEEAPPPPPGDEPRDARPEDRPPPPGDEANSPSDERPILNDGRRTSRGYAGQAPGKQAPHQAPWTQGPSKQAPMQQGPMQAPSKGTASYGEQTHTMGYSANYNCAGCGNGYQQTYSNTGYNNRGQYYARRGVFGRRWR